MKQYSVTMIVEVFGISSQSINLIIDANSREEAEDIARDNILSNISVYADIIKEIK